MKRTLAAYLGTAALVVALAPGSARADDGPSEDARARGKQLFDSALADVKREDYKSACPKFRASYDVDPKASTLLNLGTCYARNGQTASAWGAFSSAVIAAKKAGKDDWAAQAEEQVKALEPKLVRLTIQVPPAARIEGLVVVRDTSTLSESEWGLAMAVDPGEHTVKASARGHVPWQTKVTIAEGGAPPPVTIPTLAEEPKAILPPPSVREPDAGPPPFWTTSRIAGASVAGVGVVALGVGSVLGILAKGKYDDSRAACPAPTCADAAAVDANGSAFGMATGSTVLFVAGGVLAAGGVGLFLWAPDAKKRAATGHVRVFPSASRTSATLELGGTF